MHADGSGYRLDLALTGFDGGRRERTLRTATCALAVDALVVVLVASAVAPAEAVGEASGSSVAPPAEPRGSEASPTADAAEPSGARRTSIDVGARMIGSVGLLPSAAIGGAGELGVGIGSGALRFAVRGGVLASSTASTSAGSRAEIGAIVSGLSGCVAPFASLLVSGCLGMGMGFVQGEGVDVASARSETRIVPTVDAGLEARFPARSRVGVRLGVGLRYALARPDFSVRNDGSLHRPSAFGGEISAGPEVRF